MSKITNKDSTWMPSKDKTLCDQFLKNVQDSVLRKHLKQIVRAQPHKPFLDLREEAIMWSEEEEYKNKRRLLEPVCKIAENFKLRELFKACDKNTIGFLKLCSKLAVRIPANSVIILNGTGPNLPRLYDAVVEPLHTSGHLPSTFIVVHTFVTVRNGRLTFRVANIGDDDIWLAPRTRIGILLKGDVENHDKGHVEFIRTGHTEEIYIHEIALNILQKLV
ncbi:unnamed protein product [Mytilus edulis]|uniref:Uncharacterized protein n=1 Tax=Mytilus edulis TaxID=6550 RepID=A0A8S3QUF0_MYTED|nr:unnamed protein product [Mytilus edulis]